MAKTKLTNSLEYALYIKLDNRKEFGCYEVTIGWYGNERVDFISYTTDRKIICYEIKSSKPDFYSKSKKTFIGHKNYYVMPAELFDQVKDDIPSHVGVFAETEDNLLKSEYPKLTCIKKARSQNVEESEKEVILGSIIRSMSRDIDYFKILNKED